MIKTEIVSCVENNDFLDKTTYNVDRSSDLVVKIRDMFEWSEESNDDVEIFKTVNSTIYRQCRL